VAVSWYPSEYGMFATGGPEGKVMLWDAATMQTVFTFDVQAPCNSVAFSAHSSGQPVVAAGLGSNNIRLLDLRAGVAIQTMKGHAAEVLALRWDPRSEHRLASAGMDGVVSVWDVRAGSRRLFNLDRTADPELALASCWDRKDYSPSSLAQSSMQLLPGQKPCKQAKSTSIQDRGSQVSHSAAPRAAVLRSGVHLAQAKRTTLASSWDHSVSLEAAARRRGAAAHDGSVGWVDFRQGGIFTSGVDGTVRVWERETGKPCEVIHSAQAMERGAEGFNKKDRWKLRRTCAITPDASTLFTPDEKAVQCYALRPSGALPVLRMSGHYQGVTEMLYSQETGELYTAGADGLLLCWRSQALAIDDDEEDAAVGDTESDVSQWSEA